MAEDTAVLDVDEDDWPEAKESVCKGCGEQIFIYDEDKPFCFPCGCKDRGCTIVQKGPFHNRHYHCSRCRSPEATSYQGHYLNLDGTDWKFICEEKYLP